MIMVMKIIIAALKESRGLIQLIGPGLLLQLGIIGVIRTNNSKMRDFRSIRSNNPKHTIAIDLTIKTKEPNKT